MFNLLAGVLPSRRSEAHRGLPEASSDKTYWHQDKARLMGTRIYVFISQAGFEAALEADLQGFED